MAYAFDPADGATRGQLKELVCAQSFSPARYDGLLDAWLNDAVLEVCRALQIIEGAEILAHDAAGVVAQPARPFFRIRQVWAVDATATGSGHNAVRRFARHQLTAVPFDERILLTGAGGSPMYYTARRGAAAGGRHVPLAIELQPCSAPGKVGVVGLQRPAIMADDEAATGLGADLDEAVVAWTKARAFRQEDDFDMRNAWMAEYDLAIRGAGDSPIADGPVVTPGLED